jgi:pimeloyl-ACP methyl ester carboxylesterase/acyl-CoA thioesterase FadM
MLGRARWEAFARGPGIDVFSRSGATLVVRKATLEYHAEATVGTVLRFGTSLTHLGRSSFSLHQTARRMPDQNIVAEAEVVFECLGEDGESRAVPPQIRQFFGSRPSLRVSAFQHQVVRGISTAVDIQGDGPPVLFIHGFPLDRTMWRHMTAPLTGRQRIAPDLRGLGLSDAPEGGYFIEEYADDMAALLELLEVDQAVVCGLSMGGYVALEMVRRHRHRLQGLILINTRANADTAEGKAGRDEMIRMVQLQGPGALADTMLPKLLAPETLDTMPDVVERVRTMIVANQPSGVIGAISAMKERSDSTQLLGEIDFPTLVVAGRDDQLIPVDYSKAMAERIPNAHFTVMAGAGHLAPMEQPIATSRVVGEFLESLS